MGGSNLYKYILLAMRVRKVHGERRQVDYKKSMYYSCFPCAPFFWTPQSCISKDNAFLNMTVYNLFVRPHDTLQYIRLTHHPI